MFGFGVPYTDEFKHIGVNKSLLERLAALTNGKLLQLEDAPPNLFTVTSSAKKFGKALWPYLVIAFLFLLLADVVGRKIFSSISK